MPASVNIRGMEGTSFADTILGDKPALDVPRAEAELVEAATELLADKPQTGAILLECTNMVPYAEAIATATGRPVFSIYSYLTWFHQSLAPSRF